jgi:hypothetical protein
VVVGDGFGNSKNLGGTPSVRTERSIWYVLSSQVLTLAGAGFHLLDAFPAVLCHWWSSASSHVADQYALTLLQLSQLFVKLLLFLSLAACAVSIKPLNDDTHLLDVTTASAEICVSLVGFFLAGNNLIAPFTLSVQVVSASLESGGVYSFEARFDPSSYTASSIYVYGYSESRLPPLFAHTAPHRRLICDVVCRRRSYPARWRRSHAVGFERVSLHLPWNGGGRHLSPWNGHNRGLGEQTSAPGCVVCCGACPCLRKYCCRC